MRPTILHVGGVLYWTIQTRNPDTQVLKDADSTPTVAVRKNGSSVADSVTVTKRSASTGYYDCSYNPAAEVEGDTFQFEESAAVTGTTTGSATYVNQFSVRAVHAGAVELDSSARVKLAADQPDYSPATPAQVNAQVLDVIQTDTFAELAAPPAATSSLKDKITWLFMYSRNKVTQTASQRKVYRDDGTTVAGTSATSDVDGTFTKGEDS